MKLLKVLDSTEDEDDSSSPLDVSNKRLVCANWQKKKNRQRTLHLCFRCVHK